MRRYRPTDEEWDHGLYGPPIDLLPFPRHNHPCCPHVKNGVQCKAPAGSRTTHWGTGKCSRHEGSFKYYNLKQVRLYVQQKLDSGLYGDPLQISPDEALLLEVHRTAGHVEWLRQTIQQMGEERDSANRDSKGVLYQYTPAMGVTASGILQLYKEERQHLVRCCKAAIDGGVAQRRVEIAQQQAQLMAHVMLSLVNDSELGLEYEQQLKARKLIRKHLELAPETPEPLPAVIETEIV